MTKQARGITERAFLEGEALANQGLDNRTYIVTYKRDRYFGDKVLTIRNAAKRIVMQHPYPEHEAISFYRNRHVQPEAFCA